MNSYGMTRKNKNSFIKHPAGCFRGLMFTQKFGDILPPSRYSPFSAVLAHNKPFITSLLAKKMDNLEWFPCSETLDDILKNPKVQLPQLIKLSQDLKLNSDEEQSLKDCVIVIHSKINFKYLLAENDKGNELRLPINSPFRIKQRLAPGKEKTFNTILDLAKSDPLPKFVEVTNAGGENTSVQKGERFKVVIVEKSGSNPSFIHFRRASGKHIKLSVDLTISFTLVANVASEQSLSVLADKSKELPIMAEFVNEDNLPPTYKKLGPIKISKVCSEEMIISSLIKNTDDQHVLLFPLLDTNMEFKVNSKMKLEKDETIRELCCKFSSKIDLDKIIQYFDILNPNGSIKNCLIQYSTLLRYLEGNYKVEKFDAKKNKQKLFGNNKQYTIGGGEKKEIEEEESATKENTLKMDMEQRELIKKKQKEIEDQVKIEKERLKAEKKKEKKEKKEKEKEEKKKKKDLQIKSEPIIPAERVEDNLYVLPNSPITSVSQDSAEDEIDCKNEDDQVVQHQWKLDLMKKVKKVTDRTKSLGSKSKPKKKNRGITKNDIEIIHQENCLNYEDDAFSTNDSLYETLPCDSMAYESLDLIKEAERSFSSPGQIHQDSGFDEYDAAKIKEWREAMTPPPLPGNHPHQDRLNVNEDLYEVAIDDTQNKDTWNRFFSIVEQSAKELSLWDIEDVANCLDDLKLGTYRTIFSDSQIDGQLLLDLDETVLIELGLTPFEARKLRKFTFGWRPDKMRPPNYPKLDGFVNPDPSHWSAQDVVKHLDVIDMKDFAQFCEKNQINGDLLKDICIDDKIMNTIITTRDKKLKIVKIKNYVIDKWRPKIKGEGHYVKVTEDSPFIKKESSSSSSPKFNSKSSPVVQRMISNKTRQDSPSIALIKQQLQESK